MGGLLQANQLNADRCMLPFHESTQDQLISNGILQDASVHVSIDSLEDEVFGPEWLRISIITTIGDSKSDLTTPSERTGSDSVAVPVEDPYDFAPKPDLKG